MQETSAAEQGLRAQLEAELGAVRKGLQGSQAAHIQVFATRTVLRCAAPCRSCIAASSICPQVGSVAVNDWADLLVCSIVLVLHDSLIEHFQVL